MYYICILFCVMIVLKFTRLHKMCKNLPDYTLNIVQRLCKYLPTSCTDMCTLLLPNEYLAIKQCRRRTQLSFKALQMPTCTLIFRKFAIYALFV